MLCDQNGGRILSQGRHIGFALDYYGDEAANVADGLFAIARALNPHRRSHCVFGQPAALGPRFPDWT